MQIFQLLTLFSLSQQIEVRDIKTETDRQTDKKEIAKRRIPQRLNLTVLQIEVKDIKTATDRQTDRQERNS